MQKRKFDELISHFNRKVSDMSIDQKYKMELLGMISAIGFAHEKELGTNLASLGTDCISRQMLLEYIHGEPVGRLLCDKYNLDGLIEQLPPAEPKIIRCKDCKHWIPYDWMFSEMWQSKNIADYPEDEIDCEWSEMSMKANDFCSRGEKREVTT